MTTYRDKRSKLSCPDRLVPLQNVAIVLTWCLGRVAYAARYYPLITPPSTFRRCTGASSGTTTGSS